MTDIFDCPSCYDKSIGVYQSTSEGGFCDDTLHIPTLLLFLISLLFFSFHRSTRCSHYPLPNPTLLSRLYQSYRDFFSSSFLYPSGIPPVKRSFAVQLPNISLSSTPQCLSIANIGKSGTVKLARNSSWCRHPMHYAVISDDANHQPEFLMNIIYQHSYQYVRSTTSAPLQPAVYYTHLASNRAKSHENVPSSEGPTGGPGFKAKRPSDHCDSSLRSFDQNKVRLPL